MPERVGGSRAVITVIRLKGLNSSVVEVCCVMPCFHISTAFSKITATLWEGKNCNEKGESGKIFWGNVI